MWILGVKVKVEVRVVLMVLGFVSMGYRAETESFGDSFIVGCCDFYREIWYFYIKNYSFVENLLYYLLRNICCKYLLLISCDRYK